MAVSMRPDRVGAKPEMCYSRSVAVDRRVLVVDDDPACSKAWSEALESAGYAVECASDPNSAREAALSRPFELYVVDLRLPEPVGVELIEEWLRAAPERRVVAVDEGADPDGRLRLLEAGVRVVAHKPLEPAALLSALELAIEDELPPALPLEREAQVLNLSGRWDGALGEGGAVAVLAALYRRKFTGLVFLRKGERKKILNVREGAPVLVRSNVLTETLGRRLVEERMVSEAACEQALERKRGSGQRIGEILVALGHLSAKNLDFALERQARERLDDLFSWRDGEFRAVEDAREVDVMPLGEPARILFDGLGRRETAEVLGLLHAWRRHRLGTVDPEDTEFDGLSEKAKRLLRQASGSALEAALTEGDDPVLAARALTTAFLLGGLPLLAPPASPRPRSTPQGELLLGRGMPISEGLDDGPRPLALPAYPPPVEEPALPTEVRPPRGLSFGDTPKSSPSEDLVEETDVEVPPTASPDPVEDESIEISAAGTVDLGGEALVYERARERHDAVVRVSIRERLGLPEGRVTPEEVETAFQAARERLTAEMAEARVASGRCAQLAEAAEVALGDARAELLHPDTERRSRPPQEPAPFPWREALEAFEEGLSAQTRGEADEARAAFARAADLDPTIETYRDLARPSPEALSELRARARAAEPGTREADEAWSAILAIDPDDAEALRRRSSPEKGGSLWRW